ncbi:MAG TPA: 2-hydroxyacyl-CoA dehydratase family protein [Dehalococcoidales bacterium]|nr:2-hydroxyacyl-CoA dehydratase family protein [Dehalococcoidales bacterium]
MFEPVKALVNNPSVETEFLRHPLAYDLMAEVGKRVYAGRGKRAQGIWLDLIARQIKAGLKRRGLVVWGNAFFPFELLYGLGVTPYHPESVSAAAAAIGLSLRAVECAESACYSPDICSFYRCAVGLDIQKLLPAPDLVVSSSYLCEGAVKSFINTATDYGCEHYLLDVPYHQTEKSKKYVAGQLRELAEIIAKKQGKPVDMEKLALAVKLSNGSREYQLRINEMRRAHPGALSAVDATSYIPDMRFFSPGSESGVRFFRALYEEVKVGAVKVKGKTPKHRLLWMHYVRPYYPNDIIDYLNSLGAVVCFNEAGYVYWPPLDPNHPFESIAEKVLSMPNGGPLERRAELAVKLAEEYYVDGVIHFSQRGCRQSTGGEYIIRDALRKKDIPMLILDGDAVDSRNYSKEPTRLRLEAFLEMLEAKK